MLDTDKNKPRKSLGRVKKNYIGRIVIYAFFAMFLVPELIAQEVNSTWYTYIVFFLALPHIFFWLAKRSPNPEKAEKINMIIESFNEGILYTAISFSFFPLITMFTISIFYIVFYGGFRFYLSTRIVMLLGIAFCILIIGFNFQLQSSTASTYISMIVLPLTLVGLVTNVRRDYSRSSDKLNRINKKREELASKLAKYLSPQIYDQIFTGGQDARPGSQRKKLTVFFSDIVDFSKLTDGMSSEELSFFTNNYLNQMTDIALKYGGTIDKYMGDSIMIFFGDPESQGHKKDALACVHMALKMQNYIQELVNDKQNALLEIRIGINTGYCTVGNFGSEDRLDYTIIGGQVNLARKLQKNATPNQILITHETYALIQNEIEALKLEEIQVSGIAYPVQIYEVIGQKSIENFTENINGISYTINKEKINKAKALEILKKTIDTIEHF
ncbi:MAG: hypothetical protein KJP00_08540 [Bacteroidia bacterium]|nr:hypothetical protein [Bacteroidia bacterium]